MTNHAQLPAVVGFLNRRSAKPKLPEWLVVGGLTIIFSSLVAQCDGLAEDNRHLGAKTNPFATPAVKASSTALPDWTPVATARLQPPTAGGVAQPDSGSVFIGPDWSRYASAPARQPDDDFVDDDVPPLTQPARLPVTDSTPAESDMFSGAQRMSVAPNVPGRVNAQLASAAKKRSHYLAQQPPAPKAGSSVYLATQTAQSELDIAIELFQHAQLDYDYRAYASAETSAWESLQKSAQAIDLAAAANLRLTPPDTIAALQYLHRGKRALAEACDFVGPFAQNDAASIARLARAHETPVVRESLPSLRATYSMTNLNSQERSSVKLPTASQAIDQYLDYARTQFGELAARSLLAAQTMDLIAAIRLGRNELSQLPGPTAICLRRAAVQGQSGNADLAAKLGHHLADIGLVDEARWALGHSLSMQPNPTNAARLAHLNSISAHPRRSEHGQSIMADVKPNNSSPFAEPNRRTPEVVSLTPTQFAAISTSVLPGKGVGESNELTSPSTSNSSPIDRGPTTVTATSDEPSSTPARKSIMKSFVATFRRVLPGSQDEASSAPAESGSGFSSSTSESERYDGPPVISASSISPAERTSSTQMPNPKRWW